MHIPLNQFKADLRTDKLLLGLWLGLGETFSAEICAGAGFDWLLIDGEHGPNDLRTFLAQLQAIEPYRSQPIVRPPQGDHVLIKQLLETGVQTLLIPMVETAEQARGLVQAMRYPPAGIRGVGAALARAPTEAASRVKSTSRMARRILTIWASSGPAACMTPWSAMLAAWRARHKG